MSAWENYYKDWGNPTPEMMADLDKLVKKFIVLEVAMAKQSKVKPIHLIQLRYGYKCTAVCDRDVGVMPAEATIKDRPRPHMPKGTFDPMKVTCKRCLKHEDYKTVVDRIKYPLFFLKEGIV